MTKKINKFIYWVPRILGILFILFLMMLSLDVFESGLTGWQIIIALFMHNIPFLILGIALWVSWKYEIVGAVIFIIAGLSHIIFLVVRGGFDAWYEYLFISLIIDIPAFIIGILFFIGWYKKKE